MRTTTREINEALPAGRRAKLVAYFCMEYGLASSFRIYCGGLGILAGDLLKSARDLGLPMVGIGLLWRQGYYRQMLDERGIPFPAYPTYRYDFLKDTGVKVKVVIRGRQVACRVWLVDRFGNAPLYLLDTDLPENEPADRWITGQLYGWFEEERVAQEMVLGIGGVRALRALGIDPDVYHFNEGHAVFAGLELIREYMQGLGLSFADAWRRTRERIVFTTHTPVKEGNEEHGHDLLRYMGADLGLTYGQMLQLGGDPFNMTVAGLRLARMANAVSRLHARTAGSMWAEVTGAAPIIAITNGVHLGTWQDERVARAARAKDPDELWRAHQLCKAELIEFIAGRTGVRLQENVLLIGFARRAASYKRGGLIFRRPEIIEPLLSSGRLQLVLAGKGHPLDDAGTDIVAGFTAAARRHPTSVVFLPDYDMEIGRLLTRGCDVWLNNPRRPMEACGTSGMKAAVNGVLNLSVLDGWWPEACEHGVNGWQFGDGYEGPDQDERDLEALYRVLCGEVIPCYYERPERWRAMMANSIASTAAFSADRTLREYYELMYGSGII
ncbi:MAG: alpha-glucan family phosphorylase [Bacillota bacterium]